MRNRIPTIVLTLWAAPVLAQPGGARARAPLPPEQPWSGRSQALIAAPGDPWITPADASGFARTPLYDETVAWLRKLAKMTKANEGFEKTLRHQ